MCVDPISLALMVASAGLSAGGALQAGNAQARTNLMNAQAYESQAAAREQKATADAAEALRRFTRQRGTVLSIVGKSGIDVRTFSDVLADDQSESILERETILTTGKNEASMLRYQGAAQRDQAKDAKNASYVKAATGVVGAFSSVAKPNNLSGASGGVTMGTSFGSTGGWQTTVTRG